MSIQFINNFNFLNRFHKPVSILTIILVLPKKFLKISLLPNFFTLQFGQKCMYKVTVKEAKFLFNRLIENEIEEILFPKFVQPTLDTHIKQ